MGDAPNTGKDESGSSWQEGEADEILDSTTQESLFGSVNFTVTIESSTVTFSLDPGSPPTVPTSPSVPSSSTSSTAKPYGNQVKGNPTENGKKEDKDFEERTEKKNKKTDNPSVQHNYCTVCGKGGARRCSNCKQISYCGKEHQTEHWKSHKEHCFPVKVIPRASFKTGQGQDDTALSSKFLGRSRSHVMVATRSIKPGEIFFRENVILVSPGPWDADAIEVAKGRPICVSCCELIRNSFETDDEEDDDEDPPNRCSHCMWPLCNHFCETDKRHSNFECKILSDQHVSPIVLNQMPDYECILILRALLLREDNPEKWMRLLNLEAPMDACMDSEIGSVFVNTAVKFIREMCGLKQYSDSLIRQVASICFLHALCNDDHPGDSGYIYKIATYIGEVSSSVAHSCVANSEWAVIPAEEDQLRFRALVPIQAGEQITIMYNYKQLCHQGTAFRQKFLQDRYFFRCTCSRCQDPWELETSISGVRCSSDGCEGYYYQVSPSGGTLASWSCGTCGDTATSSKIGDIVTGVNEKLEAYPYKDPMGGMVSQLTETKRSILGLKRIVESHATSRLHPNHYILLNAEWKIIQNCYHYIMNMKKWAPDVVDLIISLGKKHLEIFDKLSPGMSRRRGFILYYLQSGLMESIRHGTSSFAKAQKKKITDPEKHEILKKGYQEMMKMRDESRKIFSFKGEIKNSMEEELLSFSAPDQPFISCLKFVERILDENMNN